MTSNSILKSLSKLERQNKKALKSEFKEWINAINGANKNYAVINKI